MRPPGQQLHLGVGVGFSVECGARQQPQRRRLQSCAVDHAPSSETPLPGGAGAPSAASCSIRPDRATPLLHPAAAADGTGVSVPISYTPSCTTILIGVPSSCPAETNATGDCGTTSPPSSSSSLLLVDYAGKSHVLDVPLSSESDCHSSAASVVLSRLKELVASRTGVPEERFTLQINGRAIDAKRAAATSPCLLRSQLNGAIVRQSLRLLGGSSVAQEERKFSEEEWKMVEDARRQRAGLQEGQPTPVAPMTVAATLQLPPAAHTVVHPSMSASPSPPPAGSQPPPPYHLLDDLASMRAGELTNSLIHLYRGEMGRQAQYRLRLDTSTNWAITTTAAMTVFSLGNRDIPHYFYAVILIFICVFLLFESRRYGYYMAVKNRVRQIECGFFGRVLLGPEFGKSICGLLPVDQPPYPLPSYAPNPSPGPTNQPLFTSPWMQPLKSTASTTSTATNSPASRRNATDGGDADTATQAQQQQQQQPSNPPLPIPVAHPHPSGLPVLPTIQPYLNDWTHLLYHSLLHPEVSISLVDSLLIRLRRVYLFLLLGLLTSWIIKVHLDIGLPQHWLLVTIVVMLFLLVVFVSSYYLPRQRSRMHAEKHVAAMFMSDQQRQASSWSRGGKQKRAAGGARPHSWWQEGAMRHRKPPADGPTGAALRTEAYSPLPLAHPPSAVQVQMSAFPDGSAPFGSQPLFGRNTSDLLHYWNKHSTRRNFEEEADV